MALALNNLKRADMPLNKETKLYGFKKLILIPSKRSTSSICPLDVTFAGITTLGQNGLKTNGNKEIFHIPQTPIMKPYHQVQFNIISRTSNGFKYYYLPLKVLLNSIHSCPVGCRIHLLHLCRRVRPPPPPPKSVLYMTLNNLMVRFL